MTEELDKTCYKCGTELRLRISNFGSVVECGNPFCDVRANEYNSQSDEETRDLRIECHRVFDVFWKTDIMSRREAYHWLSSVMNLITVHFGMMTKDQLYDALEHITKRMKAEAVRASRRLRAIAPQLWTAEREKTAVNACLIIEAADKYVPEETLDFLYAMRMVSKSAEHREIFRRATENTALRDDKDCDNKGTAKRTGG